MAALLLYLEPLSFPLAIILIAHAWIIPELYAKRGANVLRPAQRLGDGPRADGARPARRPRRPPRPASCTRRTGLVLERGGLGDWLVGEMGAVLVPPGGRRVHCYCVRVEDPDLPSADRIAHCCSRCARTRPGFATVANLAFAARRGACSAGCRRAPGRRSTRPSRRAHRPPRARAKFSKCPYLPRVRCTMAGMNNGNDAPRVAPASGRGTVTRLSGAAARPLSRTDVTRARDARRELRPRTERFAHLKRMYD